MYRPNSSKGLLRMGSRSRDGYSNNYTGNMTHMPEDRRQTQSTHFRVVQSVDELTADRFASGIPGLEGLRVSPPGEASIALVLAVAALDLQSTATVSKTNSDHGLLEQWFSMHDANKSRISDVKKMSKKVRKKRRLQDQRLQT